MQQMIAFFVRRGLVVNLLSVMLLLGGAYAAKNIQREAFPSVNFDVIAISGAYLGTTPKEVEQLLISPIERELKGLDGINAIRSTAFPGTMQITIEVDPNFTDRSRLVADVQQAINRARLPTDMPADPVISEIKSEQAPVLTFSIFGAFDDLTLKHLGDRIEDDVLAINGVARVFVQGDRKEEIRIVLDPARMRRHRIAINDVVKLINGWNVNAPGGTLKGVNGQHMIRIVGEFHSAADAGDLVLRANDRGGALRLRDVADISRTLVQARRYVGAQGDPALNMIVIKKGDADIIALVDRVRNYLDTIPAKYGAKVQVRAYQDFSLITRLRLHVLTSNGAIGLGLVLLLLLLFLRPAVAITTAWGLPIIFFSGLLLLYLSGVTLNLLTMFGFIMVLGLMVDDAIIIGENITWHMERGLSAEQAAIVGTQELLGPVTATVLTTVVAFLPLMYMDGIIGKFIYSIPVVVVTLLVFSWVEAIFILPNHIRDFAHAKKQPKERWLFHVIHRLYEPVLRAAIKWRYLTIILTFASLLGAGLLAKEEMKFQLFPSGAESEFYLRITLPPGTTLESTYAQLQQLDKAVRERIDSSLLETTTFVAGENSADQREALKQMGDRFGFERVIMTPFTKRDVTAFTVMDQLEQEIPPLFPEMAISFAMLAPGPPVGRALQVELTGGDQLEMSKVSQRLIDYLTNIEGVYAIESDLEGGDPELHIELNRALAAYAGIDLATVATHVRAAFDGLRVSTLKQGKEEVDVTIRYPESARRHIDTLMNLEIPNLRGGLVPLHRIAKVVETTGSNSIRHKNGNRVMNVSAEVDRDVITSKELNALVQKHQDAWLAGAKNTRVHLGGEEERSKESVQGLISSFAFAMAGIFIILAIQFNSIRYPILVMLAIPFGVIGIIVGFWLHHQPISFMAMMGFVALTGVVVNASLVMAVFIQRALAEGQAWRDAVINSGLRRLRAVLLTAITTVVGLLPTAYGWGGHDPFVSPMALALSWGLLFSTAITLFSIPAAMGIAMDFHGLGHRLKKRLLFKNPTI
ncbi:MAG: efflux RND transporter permease subunit [Mariprofundaceae bacterium]|nr:efflux RND transporter permease subunit [Mariprofundaceae bacterium]